MCEPSAGDADSSQRRTTSSGQSLSRCGVVGLGMHSEVVAKFSFDPTKGDELRLRKGDIVVVEERSEDGWWKGTCNGRTGWFPGNYTEEITKVAQPSYNPVLPQPPIASTATSGLIPNDYNSQNSAQTVPPLQVVVALFSFAPGTLDELGFCEGERLDIIEYSTKDWWTARNVSGKVGLIPNNHVRPVLTASSLRANLGGRYANQPWYCGYLDRNTVDEVLQNGAPGDYLIRDSATQPGNYSLSVNTSIGSKHFLIRYHAGKFHIGDLSFTTIDLLIKHYTHHLIVDTPSVKLTLRNPVE